MRCVFSFGRFPIRELVYKETVCNPSSSQDLIMHKEGLALMFIIVIVIWGRGLVKKNSVFLLILKRKDFFSGCTTRTIQHQKSAAESARLIHLRRLAHGCDNILCPYTEHIQSDQATFKQSNWLLLNRANSLGRSIFSDLFPPSTNKDIFHSFVPLIIRTF